MEIYMMHGLLLNIFKSSAVIQFSSIEGYLLAAGNFALTIGLVQWLSACSIKMLYSRKY